MRCLLATYSSDNLQPTNVTYTMKYLAAFSLLLLFMLPTATNVMACSCIAPEGPLEELSKSDFVFSGFVEDISRYGSDHGTTLRVHFKVLSSWKGELGEEIIVETADNSAACGYPFKKHDSYLVYGYTYEGKMRTGICTRTAGIEAARDDLTELGKGEQIGKDRPRCGGPTAAVALQTFMFLFIGMLFSRRRPFSKIEEGEVPLSK